MSKQIQYQEALQGKNLVPILFSPDINKLNQQVPSNCKKEFNAPRILYSCIHYKPTCLEQSLKKISENYERHRLTLNYSQMEFIAFSKKSKLDEPKRKILMIGNKEIANVNFEKYLCVSLDCILHSKKH